MFWEMCPISSRDVWFCCALSFLFFKTVLELQPCAIHFRCSILCCVKSVIHKVHDALQST